MLGATGFIGSWATRALVADGHEVRAIVRPESDTWRIDPIAALTTERVDAAAWPEAIAANPPETLLSLDWEGVSANERDVDSVQQRNIGRQSALYSAALGAGTRRIVGTGSQAEFGPVDGPIDDDREASPTTAYGRAKTAAHAALAEATAASNVQHVWARVFSVFGPLETGEWLLPKITRAATSGEPFAMSSATQPWSYLFAPDAGRALALLATHPRAQDAVNVGHPEAPPLRPFVERFAAAINAQLRFGETVRPGIEPRVSRLSALGWEPLWTSREAIAMTAAWFRGDGVADPFSVGVTLPLQR